MIPPRSITVFCLWCAVWLIGPAAWLPAQTAAGSGTLNAGDVVEVRVLRHDAELGGKFTLGADGTIELQLIGRVGLQGLTPEQAGRRITALLADGWLRKPQVTVNVADFARNTITVTGQVNRGGAFQVARNKPFTVSQAIGMAGGFNPRANPKAVMLKRGEKAYTINVRAILEDPSLDIPLRDGDVLFVKESRI
jgi:protein involved in polysaccharide export with SLBB domain